MASTSSETDLFLAKGHIVAPISVFSEGLRCNLVQKQMSDPFRLSCVRKACLRIVRQNLNKRKKVTVKSQIKYPESLSTLMLDDIKHAFISTCATT